MADATAYAVLDRILEPITQCLTPEAARKLVDLRADAAVQGRVDELADKSTAGLLDADEWAEYETYIAASTLIGILQSQARKILATQAVACPNTVQ